MNYKRVKYILQGVVAQIDDEGNIVGEETTQATAIYSREQLEEFVQRFDADINEANMQESMNGVPEVVSDA